MLVLLCSTLMMVVCCLDESYQDPYSLQHWKTTPNNHHAIFELKPVEDVHVDVHELCTSNSSRFKHDNPLDFLPLYVGTVEADGSEKTMLKPLPCFQGVAVASAVDVLGRDALEAFFVACAALV